MTDEAFALVARIVEWFLANYEDPVKSTPYDGAEGRYQYQCGGRYFAREELMRRFYSGLATRFRRRRLGKDEDSVHAGRLLMREETIARGSCDPDILAVADELLPDVGSVGRACATLAWRGYHQTLWEKPLALVEETRGLKLPLTREERALVDVAERFAKGTIAPIAERLEREKLPLPAPVIAEWVGCGLNGMQVSPERGGAGASFFAKVAVAEAIARSRARAFRALSH